MKNTLMVPYVFTLNLILWGCGLPFFSSLASYPDFLSLVSGNTSVFFASFAWRAVYYLPLIVMLSLLGVFVFLMRHPSVRILSFLLVTVLVFFSVVVFIPLVSKLTRERGLTFDKPSSVAPERERVFSPGLIRPDTSGTRSVWLDEQGAGMRVGPVILAPAGENSPLESLTVIPFADYSRSDGSVRSGDRVVVTRAGGLDPLVEKWFLPPRPLAVFYASVSAVMDGFRSAMTVGFIAWLVRAGSFFLAVFALWVLCFASGWRLLNIMFMLTGFIALFLLYPYVAPNGPVFAFLRPGIPAAVRDDVLSAAFYGAVTAPALVIGMVVAVRRHLAGTSAENMYGRG